MLPDDLPRFVDRIRSVFLDLQPADADELVQEALLALLRYLGPGRDFEDNERIVLIAARNVRCDHFRRRARGRAIDLPREIPDKRHVGDAELRDLLSAGLTHQPCWMRELVRMLVDRASSSDIRVAGFTERHRRKAVAFLRRLLGDGRSREIPGKSAREIALERLVVQNPPSNANRGW